MAKTQIDPKPIISARREKLREWREVQDRLNRDRNEHLKVWRRENKKLIKEIRLRFVGWERIGVRQFLFWFDPAYILEGNKIVQYIQPHEYAGYGFDRSLSGGCRKWETVSDIQRDFEILKEDLKEWFRITYEESAIRYRRRKRLHPCLKVTISLAR